VLTAPTKVSYVAPFRGAVEAIEENGEIYVAERERSEIIVVPQRFEYGQELHG
jgi:hypothetical protein